MSSELDLLELKRKILKKVAKEYELEYDLPEGSNFEEMLFEAMENYKNYIELEED